LAAENTASGKAMEYALISVLKDMAGTEAAPAGSTSVPSFETSLIHAHITFDGECSGELGMFMDPALAARIASRILGADPNEPLLQEMILDAGKELLNVICGQFLTMRFGPEPIFSLGVPRVFPLSAQACNALISSSPISLFKIGAHFLPAYVRVRQKTP